MEESDKGLVHGVMMRFRAHADSVDRGTAWIVTASEDNVPLRWDRIL
jgi:hypothetical protein